jgi:hypothetical protein
LFECWGQCVEAGFSVMPLWDGWKFMAMFRQRKLDAKR